jgi:SRSO17 transposase
VRTNTVLARFSAIFRPFFTILPRRGWRRHAAAYVLGLALMIRFRSIAGIARHTAGGAVDNLQHFLHDSPWDHRAVEADMQRRVAAEVRRRGAPIHLIIDDTPVERRGKHIEGSGIHHSSKGLVRGLCAVTALVRVGDETLAWAVHGYRPKRACARKDFQSKVDLAIEIIESADLLGPDVTVLMDAWYTCKRVLNAIAEKGWRYVAALKSNRLVVLEGRKTSVSNLAKGPREYQTVRLSKRRKVRVAKRLAVLPGIGPVAIFITKTGGGVKFLVSNDPDLTGPEAVRLYAERFGIETFHRDMKQHLGFGELWMRSWRAVQRHWTLCAVAYTALVLWNASLHPRQRGRTFGEIVRAFRAAEMQARCDVRVVHHANAA